MLSLACESRLLRCRAGARKVETEEQRLKNLKGKGKAMAEDAEHENEEDDEDEEGDFDEVFPTFHLTAVTQMLHLSQPCHSLFVSP